MHTVDEAYCYTYCVYLSVGQKREPCKNGLTDRDTVCGVDSWGKE